MAEPESEFLIQCTHTFYVKRKNKITSKWIPVIVLLFTCTKMNSNYCYWYTLS